MSWVVSVLFFFSKFYLFIYCLWLVFVVAHRLLLVGASGGCSLVVDRGLLTAVAALFLESTGSRAPLQ